GVQLSPFSLKAWDPVRYGSLSHPGDAYAYDILTQVAQVIRHPGAYDGFLLYSRQPSALPLFPGAAGAVPAGAIIRVDTVAPVISVEDEWSIAITSAWLVRQPDGPKFR